MNTEKFFMVYVDKTAGSSKKHASYIEASNEADRLCEKEKQNVYILEAIAAKTPQMSILTVTL